MDLAEIMRSSPDLDIPGSEPGSANNFYEYGTDVQQLTRFFEGLEGFKVVEKSYRPDYGPDDLIGKNDGSTPNDLVTSG